MLETAVTGFSWLSKQGQSGFFQNSPNTANSTILLDIRDRVLFSGEQGLLGLALHLNFTKNGYLYVDYVAAIPEFSGLTLTLIFAATTLVVAVGIRKRFFHSLPR